MRSYKHEKALDRNSGPFRAYSFVVHKVAATPAEQVGIAALVETILAAKAVDPTGHGPAADTSAAEAAVDARVAALYGVALPVAAGGAG